MNHIRTLNTVFLQQQDAMEKPMKFKSRIQHLRHLGALSHKRSLGPDAINHKLRKFEEIKVIDAAMRHLAATPAVSDGEDLSRLHRLAEELYERIPFALNGERARLEVRLSECLKSISQLTVLKIKSA